MSIAWATAASRHTRVPSATARAWSSRQSTSTEGLSISSAPRTISLASIHTLEVIREHLLGNSFSERLTHFTREPEMNPHNDSSVLHFFDCVRHAVELTADARNEIGRNRELHMVAEFVPKDDGCGAAHT